MTYVEKCLLDKNEIKKLDEYIKDLLAKDISEEDIRKELGFTEFEWNIISRNNEDFEENILDIIENRKFLEPRNQFLNLNSLILEISDETKNQAAYLKVAIPSVLAQKLLKQFSTKKEEPIKGLRLSYLDTDLK